MYTIALACCIYTKIIQKYDTSKQQIGVFFIRKMLISFLLLHENICCRYSLEEPQQGASNEYHNICFPGEIRKILCGYPLLSVAMIHEKHSPFSSYKQKLLTKLYTNKFMITLKTLPHSRFRISLYCITITIQTNTEKSQLTAWMT